MRLQHRFFRSTVCQAGIKTMLTAVFFLTFFILVAFFWFGSLPFRTFMGDDLWLVGEFSRGAYAESFLSIFSGVVIGKYRPVFTAIFFLMTKFMELDWRNFFYLNIGLHALNALVFSRLAFFLSGGKLFAYLVGLLVIFSRFSYHYVLLVWGPMEELALLFIGLIIGLIAYAYKKQSFKSLLLALVPFFLIIFTHERFLFTFIFLCFAYFLFPFQYRNMSQRIFCSLIPVSIVGLYYFVKVHLLQVGFLAGAGSDHSGSFSLAKIASLAGNGFLNLFGFNAGPSYLAGIDFRALGWVGYGLGFALSVSVAIVFYMYFSENFSLKEKIQSRIFFLLVVMIILLVGAASVSVHQEFRWLLAPYAVFLLFLSFIIGQMKSRLVSGVLAGLIFFSALAVDGYYRKWLPDIYFVRSLATADSAREEIIERHKKELDSKKIVIVTNGFSSVRNWTFLDKYFFQFYSKNPDIQVEYVESRDDLAKTEKNPCHTLIFNVDEGLMIREITSETGLCRKD